MSMIADMPTQARESRDESPLSLSGSDSPLHIWLMEVYPIACHQEDGWLRFDGELPAEAADFPRLLAWNALAPGPAKCCLSADGRPRLRAEVPVDSEDTEAEGRLHSTLACLERALEALQQEPRACAPQGATPMETPDVKALCESAGWPCVERAPGHWMAELAGTPQFCQAEITAQEGDLHFTVVLAEWRTLEAPVLAALSHFLLTASGAFRMIRAAIEEREDGAGASLVARLPYARVSDLPHMLSALSVGACRTLRETLALLRPDVARLYAATAHANHGSIGSQ